MPITGAYIITSHASNSVEGFAMSSWTIRALIYKGNGAQARAIFNGKVVAVLN